MRIVSLASALLLLSLLSFASTAYAQSWGLEVGRASDQDVFQLRADLARLKELNKRWPELDYPNREGASVNIEKERQIQRFNLDEVWPVILRLVQNPAAACAVVDSILDAPVFHFQAKRLTRSPEEESGLTGWTNDARQGRNRRCREEALDECVKTGRYQAILDYRPFQPPEDSVPTTFTTHVTAKGLWRTDALRQCANYELKFESKGSGQQPLIPAGTVSYGAVVEGSIKIKFNSDHQDDQEDYFF